MHQHIFTDVERVHLLAGKFRLAVSQAGAGGDLVAMAKCLRIGNSHRPARGVQTAATVQYIIQLVGPQRQRRLPVFPLVNAEKIQIQLRDFRGVGQAGGGLVAIPQVRVQGKRAIRPIHLPAVAGGVHQVGVERAIVAIGVVLRGKKRGVVRLGGKQIKLRQIPQQLRAFVARLVGARTARGHVVPAPAQITAQIERQQVRMINGAGGMQSHQWRDGKFIVSAAAAADFHPLRRAFHLDARADLRQTVELKPAGVLRPQSRG